MDQIKEKEKGKKRKILKEKKKEEKSREPCGSRSADAPKIT